MNLHSSVQAASQAVPHVDVEPRRISTTPAASIDHEGSHEGDSDHSRVRTGPKIKLPKSSLPQFKGDPLQWTSFWDADQSAVHNNSELPEVDKFNYLQSLLDCSALDAITGLTFLSANYLHVIKIL